MTAKMKPEDRKIHVSIAFDPDVMRRLNAQVKLMRISRSALVNICVDSALKQEEKKIDKHIAEIERLWD